MPAQQPSPSPVVVAAAASPGARFLNATPRSIAEARAFSARKAVASLAALRARFTEVFKPARLVSGQGFVASLRQHLQTTGLRPSSGKEDEPGRNVIQVVSRPAMDHTFFVVDPTTLSVDGPVKAYSVPTKEALNTLRQRGFIQIDVTHLSGNPRYFPVAPGEGLGQRDSEEEGEGDAAAPAAEVVLPESFPSFVRGPAAQSIAQQIVAWMETGGVGEDGAFSPMKLWDKERRTRGKIDRAAFNRICKVYVYIRSKALRLEEKKTYKDLQNDASAWTVLQNMKGDEGWWDRAVKLAADFVDTE